MLQIVCNSRSSRCCVPPPSPPFLLVYLCSTLLYWVSEHLLCANKISFLAYLHTTNWLTTVFLPRFKFPPDTNDDNNNPGVSERPNATHRLLVFSWYTQAKRTQHPKYVEILSRYYWSLENLRTSSSKPMKDFFWGDIIFIVRDHWMTTGQQRNLSRFLLSSVTYYSTTPSIDLNECRLFSLVTKKTHLIIFLLLSNSLVPTSLQVTAAAVAFREIE